MSHTVTECYHNVGCPLTREYATCSPAKWVTTIYLLFFDNYIENFLQIFIWAFTCSPCKYKLLWSLLLGKIVMSKVDASDDGDDKEKEAEAAKGNWLYSPLVCPERLCSMYVLTIFWFRQLLGTKWEAVAGKYFVIIEKHLELLQMIQSWAMLISAFHIMQKCKYNGIECYLCLFY